MKDQNIAPLPDTAFWTRYQGRFFGILNWPDVDALWDILKATPDDWYVFSPEHAAPTAATSAGEFTQAVDIARELVNTRRDRSHSGAVYVDDLKTPTFIKIFDPADMGTSCGISGVPVLPRWIISRIKPDTMPAAPQPAKNPNLFKRITGRA